MELLHYVSRECWLDAQGDEAVLAGYALRHYLTQIFEQPSAQAETTVARHLQELAELREEIEQLAVPADEDDEETISTASDESIKRALIFVERMYQYTTSQDEAPRLPSVFATRDRGIQLFWKIDRQQTLLIFRPGKQTVEVGLKNPDELSSRQEVSVTEALDYARRAMRDK